MGEIKNEQEEVTVTAAAEKKSAVPNISMSYALPLHSDMLADMKTEVLETCIVACEKFPENLDEAARVIKSEMENRFCGHWHVVIGEAFGFEVSHEIRKILYTYFGGNIAILIWCL